MGANGDAGYSTSGSALDFLVNTLAHVGGISQGTLAPRSLNTARVSFRGGDNLALIRVYPSRIGNVHPKRVDQAVPVRASAENLPFDPAATLGALGAAASVVPRQIASGRTRSLR